MRTTKRGLADLRRMRKEAAKAAPPESRVNRAAPAPSSVRVERRDGTLDAADIRLFRRTVKAVHPIKASNRILLEPVPRAPRGVLEKRRETATGGEPVELSRISDHFRPARRAPDETFYLKPGCGPDVIKNLRRGKWPVGASLDLHNATVDEARTRLDQFLQSCISHGIRCVVIVHGKGYGSRDGAPVLKESVRSWLSQLSAVLAFTECAEQDGGAGAVQVLLQPEEHANL